MVALASQMLARLCLRSSSAHRLPGLVALPQPQLGCKWGTVLSTTRTNRSAAQTPDVPQPPIDWLSRPIGTLDSPVTPRGEDRYMDLKRFIVACVYRAQSDPMPSKAPLPAVLFSMHAATAYAAATLLVCPPSAGLLAGCGVYYSLLTFAITGGYHRYFSHRHRKPSHPILPPTSHSAPKAIPPHPTAYPSMHPTPTHSAINPFRPAPFHRHLACPGPSRRVDSFSSFLALPAASHGNVVRCAAHVALSKQRRHPQ